MIRITDTIAIEERELDERFVRASGPGGQNVNKVATAVELRFDVGASSLPADVKHRLIALAGSRLTADGVLLIDSREHRTQAQNREAARARLVALLQHAAKRPKVRRPTKPKRAAKEQRLESKRQRSEVKSMRRRSSRDRGED
jgi:ribosome-associated protein